MKSLLSSLAGGGSGGNVGMGRMVETLLAHTLNAKANEADPIDRMLRFLDVGKKMIDVEELKSSCPTRENPCPPLRQSSKIRNAPVKRQGVICVAPA
jgi:hypothetical protein